jgi:hypothetical protein
MARRVRSAQVRSSVRLWSGNWGADASRALMPLRRARPRPPSHLLEWQAIHGFSNTRSLPPQRLGRGTATPHTAPSHAPLPLVVPLYPLLSSIAVRRLAPVRPLPAALTNRRTMKDGQLDLRLALAGRAAGPVVARGVVRAHAGRLVSELAELAELAIGAIRLGWAGLRHARAGRTRLPCRVGSLGVLLSAQLLSVRTRSSLVSPCTSPAA